MNGKFFIFRFSDIEVREREFCLIKSGESIPVEPKAFRVLLFLLHNPQKLIPKDELLNAVWGDTAVTENSLARSIALLRRLLGDETRSPRFIETVATVGYRLLCPVQVLVEEDISTRPEAGGQAATVKVAARRWWIPAAVAVAMAVVGWYLSRPLSPPRITAYTQLTHDGNKKWVAGTDGSRIYLFLQSETDPIGEVSVSGGEIARIPIAMRSISALMDVSPDGSNFLVQSNESGFSDTRPVWNVRMPEGSSRRLPGLSESARFSPDGKLVAYAAANGEVWVVGSDGSGARKLTSSPDSAVNSALRSSDFAWSPDARLIRFSKSGRLWEISAEGKNLRELLPNWPRSSVQQCGKWTPDGRFFVFQSKDKWYDWGGQIWAMDERRGLLGRPRKEPVQLTSGPIRWGCPVPSRDSKQIFAEGWTDRGELQRLDGKTGQLEPFLAGISAVGVTFSRDGQRVAYVKYNEGTLWMANRDGSHAVQLTYPPANVVMPRWSPDGTQISFIDPNRTPINGYMVPASGGEPRVLSPGGVVTEASWSADGKSVVFSNSVTASRELRILNLESQRVTSVPDSLGTYSPRWSPDGRSIAGLTKDSLGVTIFDLEKQKWATFPQKVVVGYPEWSSDSRFIYFLRTNTAGDIGVYRLRVANGETELVLGLKDFHMTGWFFQWLGLDATDAPLVLKDVGTHDIYALALEAK